MGFLSCGGESIVICALRRLAENPPEPWEQPSHQRILAINIQRKEVDNAAEEAERAVEAELENMRLQRARLKLAPIEGDGNGQPSGKRVRGEGPQRPGSVQVACRSRRAKQREPKPCR